MIRAAIGRPVAVSMIYTAVSLLGLAAWRNIPIEHLPDAQLPRLTVRAEWPGASPETTEAFLTSPLESTIQLVRGVENVESTSGEENGRGTAEIQVEFARGTDMDFARLDLSERLAALESELPDAVRPPMVEPYIPEEFEDRDEAFMTYTVTGPYTLEALRAHIDDIIMPELLQIDGVANVVAAGGRRRLLEIALHEEQVRALGLSPLAVRERIANLEIVREAGAVERGGMLRTLAIRHDAASVDEVLRAPLLTDGGRVVRVRDVASVHNTYEDPIGHYRIDGLPAVGFRVFREIGTNVVDVADHVRARMAEMEPLHPIGTRIILNNDESEDVKAQLSDLRYRALVAALVIFIVLVTFLRSLRSAAIIFVTIGFSILIALNLTYFAGLSLNVLTLMGLAMGFGLMVDNAIVVLENVYRRRHRGEPAEIAAERGAREVALPILAATMTTVIVFIPFVYLQEEARVYYVPLAIVVGMSLIASLFVAFSFIPSVAATILADRRQPISEPERPPAIYTRIYRGLIGATLRYPWVTVAVSVLALGGSAHLFNRYVTRGILWGFGGLGRETSISIQIQQPRGAELERTDELARFFEQRLAAMPEVEQFVTQAFGEAAFIRVTFPDSLENTVIPPAIKEQLLAYSLGFGGADVRVYGYGPSFYAGGGGNAPNYQITVLGYNFETVRDLAEGLAGRLRRFSRVRDIDANATPGWRTRERTSEFTVNINRPRLGAYGLTAEDVVRQVQASVGGQTAQAPIRLGGEEVQFEVKYAGYREMDELDLANLLLPSAAGEAVRLSDVAEIRERDVLNQVVRENQQYRRVVSYEFRGPTRLGDQIRDVVVAATDIPDGYEVIGQQDWQWDVEDQRQIAVVLLVALTLVFMVSAALFESVRQPLCVLLAVPMALVGVFLVFFFAKASFTREAHIGVIMMGGIVVNNAILLVDHVNQLRRAEGIGLHAAILRGTLERVRPILMTSTTTVLGLLPLVLFSETADANIWNALTLALIGGLTSSTIFVLTLTPALYLLFERGPERRRLATQVTSAA